MQSKLHTLDMSSEGNWREHQPLPFGSLRHSSISKCFHRVVCLCSGEKKQKTHTHHSSRNSSHPASEKAAFSRRPPLIHAARTPAHAQRSGPRRPLLRVLGVSAHDRGKAVLLRLSACCVPVVRDRVPRRFTLAGGRNSFQTPSIRFPGDPGYSESHEHPHAHS